MLHKLFTHYRFYTIESDLQCAKSVEEAVLMELFLMRKLLQCHNTQKMGTSLLYFLLECGQCIGVVG